MEYINQKTKKCMYMYLKIVEKDKIQKYVYVYIFTKVKKSLKFKYNSICIYRSFFLKNEKKRKKCIKYR